MAVHVLAKLEHSDGKPAVGVPLWLVDRSIESVEHGAVFRKNPACRTNAAGECAVVVVYYYCETVYPWRRRARMSYSERFELVTLRNGNSQALGRLQGVKGRGVYIEGTLWARID